MQAGKDLGAVFDLALPPKAIYDTVCKLPDGCTALIQKPLGADYNDATRIVNECSRRKITASVNFQLRFTSMMLAIRDAIKKGLLGDVYDVDFDCKVFSDWSYFPFLKNYDHVDIPLHSIHYLDSMRNLIGDPTGVYARTLKHQDSGVKGTTRTSAILDYGEAVRCSMSVNHHYHGPKAFQCSLVRVCGTKGTAVAKLGVDYNYPDGEPDELHFRITDIPEAAGKDGISIPLEWTWFPDAFIGTMSNLQRFAAGEDKELLTRVEDAAKTMAVVETCLASSAQGGMPLPK